MSPGATDWEFENRVCGTVGDESRRKVPVREKRCADDIAGVIDSRGFRPLDDSVGWIDHLEDVPFRFGSCEAVDEQAEK